MTSEDILKALNWRYAVQVFDSSQKVSEEILHTILESGRLAPSSFGIEPWKFIVVQNHDLRARIQEAGYGQPKITEASALVVVAYRTDAAERISQDRIREIVRVQGATPEQLQGLKDMIDSAVKNHVAAGTLEAWVKAQTYIALGMMIETAALLGVDGGPMEGFSPDAVDEILGLKEKKLHATALLALGYRGNDSAAERPKVRREFSQVVEVIA